MKEISSCIYEKAAKFYFYYVTNREKLCYIFFY